MAYTFAYGAMRVGGVGEGPAKRVKLSRRRVLAYGAGLAIALAAGAAVIRTRGYRPPPGRQLLALSAWQFVVVEHAARRIAAPDRPDDASIPAPDDLDVAGFVDVWLSRMNERVRRDLGRFLAYLEHVAPIASGFAARFTRLRASEQDAVLASLEASSHDLLRAGFEGLRSLIFVSYYRKASTWPILGYDGPLVGRPTEGWR